MKSIKTKLIMFSGILIVVICVGSGIISFRNSSNALKSNLEKTLPNISEQIANNISGKVKGQLDVLEAVAERDDINNPNNSFENKSNILTQEGKRIGSIRIEIADKDGNIKKQDGTITNVKEREYFQNALNGNSNVSDPIISKTDKSIMVVYSVPLKYNDEIIGVLIEIRDGNDLSEITNQVKFGQTGNVFMIQKNGIIIASDDKEQVLDMYNPIEEAKKDSSLQQLSDIENKMSLGEKGLGEYIYNDQARYIGYSPVTGTEWSVGISVMKSEILSELDGLKFYTILSSTIFLIVGLVVIYLISNSIAQGISLVSKHLKLLSEGNLYEEISGKYLKGKDEIGIMTNSMRVMQDSIKTMIIKIKDSSLDVNIQSENLSAISEEIASASQNVTEAITQVAKGTNIQTNELIEIEKILNEFSNKLSNMVMEIRNVDSNSREIGTMASDSSNEMNQLDQSVNNVSKLFKEFYGKINILQHKISEINEIINLINNIAKQTNLLALNAAIEAARVGEEGKGFSVVAEEIRNLAEQSKTSSESISRLIISIDKSANEIVNDSNTMDNELINQVNVIDSSIKSFKKIIDAVDKVIPKINTIKDSAENIDSNKNLILNRIESLSSISSEASASAEEISASAEEMNASTEEVASSAQVLNNSTNKMIAEIEKFKV